MRNVLAYDLSRDMGHYSSRSKFVDLYVNDSYRGIYILMEKLKRDPERINVSKNKDGETGYILKVDRPSKDSSGDLVFTSSNSFVSKFGSDVIPDDYTTQVHFLYDYPNEDDITVDQKDYISNYVGEFETSLASPDFIHPTTGKGYGEYIDVGSFIDFMIINEISNNLDGYRLSTFMHKDEGEKLKMGPVWDFDIGFGNHIDCQADLTNSWGYYFHTYCPSSSPVPFWFPRLVQDPEFVSKFQERWVVLRKDVLDTENIFQQIENYAEELSGSVNDNFAKWKILGIYVWPNKFIGKTYREEVDYFKSWLGERLTWMDGAIEAGDMTIEDGNSAGTLKDKTNFGTAETVEDENTAETVEDENTTETVEDENTAETIEDENTAETVEDENTADTIEDENTVETVDSDSSDSDSSDSDSSDSDSSEDDKTGEVADVTGYSSSSSVVVNNYKMNFVVLAFSVIFYIF